MTKATNQRTPADIELTNYQSLEVIFTDKKDTLLFSVHFAHEDSSRPLASLEFKLYLGDSTPKQELVILDVHAPLKRGAKKSHVEAVTIDRHKSFTRHWHVTVNGLTRFSLQYNGDTDGETLAFFTVFDEQGDRVSSFEIEQEAAAKMATARKRETAKIESRAEDLLTVQDRREWENERYIELHDHFTNSDAELKELFMAILEAKAAPDDKKAQCKMLGYYLAAILTNNATPASIHNAVGDHVNDLGYKDSPAVIGGVLLSHHNSKASEAEKGGES